MSDDNGGVVADHDTPTPATRHTSGRVTTASTRDTTASLRATTMGVLHVDGVVVAQARVELDRRYHLLRPDPTVALGILLAEGLVRCETAWRERHEHALDVAGYERGSESKATAVRFPLGLVDAVNALAAAQYRGVGKVAGLVASAALLHGVTVSAKLAPVKDPGLDALAARVTQ